MKQFYQYLVKTGHFLESPFLLLVRLIWGWAFFMTGFSKLQNVHEIAGYFGTLGIPFPVAQAIVVGFIEMVGGILLMIGFASRLAALALICVMVGALYFAHYDVLANAYDDFQKIFSLSPFSFLFASLVIFIFGPGKFSLSKD